MKKVIVCLIFICSFLFSEIIDTNTKEINLKKVNRIVVIGPGALRLVTYMKLQDKLIGIENTEHKAISFSEYRTVIGKSKIDSLPIIGPGGPGKFPNLEMLISLKPDVIVATYYDKKQLESIYNKINIPIVLLNYGLGHGGYGDRLEAIKSSFKLLGKIFNKEKRANSLINFMNEQEKEFKNYKIEDKKIYVGGMGFRGAHGITSSEKYYLPFEMLGISNVLTKKAKVNHMFIQEESLISYNPDIIFLDIFGKKIIKENLNTKKVLYKSLKAFNDKKIFWLLPYNFYNTNISNVYINSWIILKRLNYDINVKEKMSQTYKAFYGEEGMKKLIKSRYPLKSFEWGN